MPPTSALSQSVCVENARGELGAHAVGAERHAAGDRLADRQQIRVEAVLGRVAAGPAADGVRLVDRQQRARLAGELAQRLVKARLGQDDADVGQRRLGQHQRDVAGGELALECLDVVELDHPGRLGELHRWADVARPGDDGVAVEGGEGLVDGAVVAVVEDQDLRPAGDLAGDPDREAVGVGGRERELPVAAAEAAGQLLADHDRVLARQHRRDPAGRALADRGDGRRGRVAGHRAGVAEAEVGVAMPVDVDQRGALGLGDEDREARPASGSSSSSAPRRAGCPARARRARASADARRRSARARARTARATRAFAGARSSDAASRSPRRRSRPSRPAATGSRRRTRSPPSPSIVRPMITRQRVPRTAASASCEPPAIAGIAPGGRARRPGRIQTAATTRR